MDRVRSSFRDFSDGGDDMVLERGPCYKSYTIPSVRTVKVSIGKARVAPGYVLAFSDEYRLEGRVVHPQYRTEMTEFRSTLAVASIKIMVVSRTYEEMEKPIFAAEVEIESPITPRVVRVVLSMVIGLVGTMGTMVGEVEDEFMRMARSADHVII